MDAAMRPNSFPSRSEKIGTRFRRSAGAAVTRGLCHTEAVRLTIVGCSPAWPNPGGAQSGYLVEGAGRVLLDCGPGVLARLREREGWPRVDAVVLTHLHLDHWGDLDPSIFGASFGAGRGGERAQLWLPPGGSETLRSFGARLAFAPQIDGVFDVHEYEDGVPFTTAGFEVTPLRLLHYTVGRSEERRVGKEWRSR